MNVLKLPTSNLCWLSNLAFYREGVKETGFTPAWSSQYINKTYGKQCLLRQWTLVSEGQDPWLGNERRYQYRFYWYRKYRSDCDEKCYANKLDNVDKIEKHKLAKFTHSSKGLRSQGFPFSILKANNGGSSPSNILNLSGLSPSGEPWLPKTEI